MDALRQDLRKPEVETLSSELGVVISHLRYVDSGLRRWMEPKPLPASLSQAGIKSYLYLEPKGNALIIAPWNYPFNLTVRTADLRHQRRLHRHREAFGDEPGYHRLHPTDAR